MTSIALGVSLAMILSYIELLLPPIFTAVPGIKLGLPNVIIIFFLYKFDAASAWAVSIIRVCLSALLFGTVMTFAYSIAGAVVSLLGMWLLKKSKLFSTVGISITGGILHNLAQITVAAIILATREIAYYMLILAVTGTVAGIFVGVCAAALIKYIKKI